MDPITTGLFTNLLAAGLLNRINNSPQKLQAVFQKAEFYAEIDAIETEFHRTLRDAIAERSAARETDELREIVDHWDAVVERLEASSNDSEGDTDRLIFRSETDAIDQLSREIVAVHGYDLDTTPKLQQDLKRAVAEAYRVAVASFGERLVDAELDEQFVTEAAIEELAALDRLQDRLAELEERLTHPRFYELYRGDADGRRRASQMVDPQALEFVSRPELDEKRTSQRLLVLGPDGSGKSRALAELVATADPEIEHIIRPKAALQTPQDLKPLRSESFHGDVLLVWDDIHAISPETGNTVFRKAITELKELLEPEHELHVLAAARSNRVASLPGEIQSTDSQLWSAFETVELGGLDEEEIETLFDRVLAKEGVVAGEDVRSAFVEKAKATDPSPLYVMSVVETVDGVQLTRDDIEVLSEDTLTVWQEQYATIKSANDNRRFVLWAVKLLSEFSYSAHYHSLLKGVYVHVLGQDELTFKPPVEQLCEHQWLVPQVDEQDEKGYVVHDAKAKAIDESIDGRLSAYSTFLFEEIDEYLPATEKVEHQLHENYAAFLQNKSLVWDARSVEKHCKRALTLDSECVSAHTTYANLLYYELDEPDTAKEQYEQAIAIDPEDAAAHHNYANLLYSELDELETAKEHYEQALSGSYRTFLTHYNYANLLYYELDEPETAKEHYEQALAIDSEETEIHYNYANLMKSDFDKPETAKEHYERAIAIDSEHAEAHTNYAILLHSEFDQIETAKEHYEQALAIDSDVGPAHNNYAVLLANELDTPKKAQHHFDRGITIRPDDIRARCYYGSLLFEDLDSPEVAKHHLETALRLVQDTDDTETELFALSQLVRVSHALDEETTALSYCERGLDLPTSNPAATRWFEGAYALLTEADCRTPYTHGLRFILDEEEEFASELFELVWMGRDDHAPDSDTHDVVQAAGVTLAALG